MYRCNLGEFSENRFQPKTARMTSADKFLPLLTSAGVGSKTSRNDEQGEVLFLGTIMPGEGDGPSPARG